MPVYICISDHKRLHIKKFMHFQFKYLVGRIHDTSFTKLIYPFIDFTALCPLFSIQSHCLPFALTRSASPLRVIHPPFPSLPSIPPLPPPPSQLTLGVGQRVHVCICSTYACVRVCVCVRSYEYYLYVRCVCV